MFLDSALGIAARERPGIILLDINDDSSLDLFSELFNVAQNVRVLVLIGLRDPEAHARAMRLIKAIEKAHGAEAQTIDLEAGKIATLTKREREIIALICQGLKNKQIGERLFISDTTVRHHLTSVFDKLGVSNRRELFIYARQCGLDKPPHSIR